MIPAAGGDDWLFHYILKIMCNNWNTERKWDQRKLDLEILILLSVPDPQKTVP